MNRKQCEKMQLAEIKEYISQHRSPLELSNKYLKMPFSCKVHAQVFIAYCEVVILPSGKIEYAIPSHTKKLEEIFKKQEKLSDDDFICLYYNNFDAYDIMLKKTKICQVWYNNIRYDGELTKAQVNKLLELIKYGCVSESILQEVNKYL